MENWPQRQRSRDRTNGERPGRGRGAGDLAGVRGGVQGCRGQADAFPASATIRGGVSGDAGACPVDDAQQRRSSGRRRERVASGAPPYTLCEVAHGAIQCGSGMVAGFLECLTVQPPCVTPGKPLNACARQLYAEKVNGHVDLSAEWAGWKLRGKWLVSPGGHRINPERLRGILFREDGEQRIARARAKAGHQGEVLRLREPLLNRLDIPGTETPG